MGEYSWMEKGKAYNGKSHAGRRDGTLIIAPVTCSTRVRTRVPFPQNFSASETKLLSSRRKLQSHLWLTADVETANF